MFHDGFKGGISNALGFVAQGPCFPVARIPHGSISAIDVDDPHLIRMELRRDVAGDCYLGGGVPSHIRISNPAITWRLHTPGAAPSCADEGSGKSGGNM